MLSKGGIIPGIKHLAGSEQYNQLSQQNFDPPSPSKLDTTGGYKKHIKKKVTSGQLSARKFKEDNLIRQQQSQATLLPRTTSGVSLNLGLQTFDAKNQSSNKKVINSNDLVYFPGTNK